MEATTKEPMQLIHCQLCKRRFTSSQVLAEHQLSAHRLASPGTGVSCSICQIEFIFERDLECHKKKCKINNKQQTAAQKSQDTVKKKKEPQFKCDLCPTPVHFLAFEELEEHVIDTHVVDKEFYCLTCPKAFITQDDLEHHAQSCLTSHSQFIPPGTNDDNEVKNNNSSNKSEEAFSSSLEPEVEKTAEMKIPEPPTVELKIIENTRDCFPCPKCDKKFETKWDLQYHAMSAHPEIMWSCELCHVVCLKLEQLVHHRNRKHPAASRISTTLEKCQKPCKYCPELLSSSVEFVKHIQAHFDVWKRNKKAKGGSENKSRPVTTATTNKNPVAPPTSIFREVYKAVQSEACRSKKAIKCAHCPKIFFHGTGGYRQHLVNAHGKVEKRWKCPQCPAKFFQKSHLYDSHLPTHSQERPFVCEYCSERFKTKNVWWGHVQWELKKREREVREVNMAAESETCLTSAQTVDPPQNNDHDYSCPLEPVSSSVGPEEVMDSPKKVKIELLFPCQECDQVCGTKWELQRHVMSVHKLNWSCEVCHSKFLFFEQLVTHRNIEHPEASRTSETTGRDVKKPCKYCPRLLDSAEELEVHIQSHKAAWKRKREASTVEGVNKKKLAVPTENLPVIIQIQPLVQSLNSLPVVVYNN